VGKHRLPEDDETILLPPPVAAPVPDEPRPRASGRQPLLIAVATMVLLVSAAAAWAVVKPSRSLPRVMPSGGASATGAGFVDGFGLVAPSATVPPEPAPTRPSPTSATSAAPAASAGPTAAGPTAAGTTPPQPSSTPADAAPSAVAAAGAAATYSENTRVGGYVITVEVRNTGSTPLDWTVRIKLPPDATVTDAWEANRSVEDGVWVFTSQRGAVAPGETKTFGFMGERGLGGFPVTCTVNGIACQAG
jgi:hypothetical protein